MEREPPAKTEHIADKWLNFIRFLPNGKVWIRWVDPHGGQHNLELGTLAELKDVLKALEL